MKISYIEPKFWLVAFLGRWYGTSVHLSFTLLLKDMYKMSKDHLKFCGTGTSPAFWVYLNLYGDRLCWFFPLPVIFISLNAPNTPAVSPALRATHSSLLGSSKYTNVPFIKWFINCFQTTGVSFNNLLEPAIKWCPSTLKIYPHLMTQAVLKREFMKWPQLCQPEKVNWITFLGCFLFLSLAFPVCLARAPTKTQYWYHSKLVIL